MAHVPQRIIRAANRRAQRRLRAVLDANAGHDPGHRTTRLYWQSERLLDALKGEPSFDAMDWRTAALTGSYPIDGTSHDPLPDIALADPGDVFVYPMGVGR